MTANEKIARWAGWSGPLDVFTSPYPWIEPDPSCYESEGFQHWHPPAFDTNIALWHGEAGLLAEIEEKELTYEFSTALHKILDPEVIIASAQGLVWLVVRHATPAQLAAALCEVIPDDT